MRSHSHTAGYVIQFSRNTVLWGIKEYEGKYRQGNSYTERLLRVIKF